MSELNCTECGEIIGFYEDSGAPHYHLYYCHCCVNKLEGES